MEEKFFPPSLPPRVGELVALRFRDPLGQWDDDGPFFKHDDGFWYRVSPPTRIEATVVGWRTAEEDPTHD